MDHPIRQREEFHRQRESMRLYCDAFRDDRTQLGFRRCGITLTTSASSWAKDASKVSARREREQKELMHRLTECLLSDAPLLLSLYDEAVLVVIV